MKINKFMSSFSEVIRAMGIVFGDIGTSPIYTLTIVFFLIEPTEENIIGVLSLIFWTLIVVVTIQYAWLGMSLSIKGEGGIIVLKESLSHTFKKGKKIAFASALAYFGIALLIGDGIIPLKEILLAIESTGYQGFYDIEIMSDDVWNRDYDQLLRDLKSRFAQLLG